MTSVRVACNCGQMHGFADVSPSKGNRAACYCRDCQAYAHHLATDGILDAHGGSDIYQTTPSHLTIDKGAKQLACMGLSPKGLLRWYAACCRPPVANTLPWPRMPFVGIAQPFMRHSAALPRNEVLYSVRTYVNEHSAVGGQPPGIRKTGPLDMLHLTRILAGGILRGEQRPFPFFGLDRKPTVTPTVMSNEARASP